MLALGVVAVEPAECLLEAGAVEREDAGVDLADRELLGGRVAPPPLASTTRSTLPCAVADTRPYRAGSSRLHRRHRARGSGLLVRLDELLDRLGGDQRDVAVEHDDRGVGVDVLDRGRHRVARSRSGCAWIAISTPSGSASSSRRFGSSTTTTFPAPASCAATTGHRISGRPQSGCRTLGSESACAFPRRRR